MDAVTTNGDEKLFGSSVPLVTIVIPIYNVEKYIHQCLKSVMEQTYKNLEILCIDDNGEDASIDVVCSLCSSDARIKIIKHDKNLGLGPARNTGINAATGEFVYFLDSDDWIMPNTIEKLVEKALLMRSDIVIGRGCAFADLDDTALKKSAEDINIWLKLKNIPERVSIRNFRYSVDAIPCVAWGKLYRFDFLVKNRLMFAEKKIRHEDNGFHIKCLARSPTISVVDEAGYQYRIRAQSLMNFGQNNDPRELDDMLLSIQDAFKYLCDIHKGEEYISIAKDLYWKFFAFKKWGFSFYWGGYTKILRIWNITIFKWACSHEWLKLRVLGFTLWKRRDVIDA